MKRTLPSNWRQHTTVRSVDQRLLGQLSGAVDALANEDDCVFFEQHDALRADSNEGKWWRGVFGGILLRGQRIALPESDQISDSRRAIAFAPHPLPFAALAGEHWRDDFLDLVLTGMRELVPRLGGVDYVGASFSGHALPSEDDYGMLCFIDSAARWWAVDPVSVFYLGPCGGDSLNTLLLYNPWQEHVGIVGEPWKDRFARFSPR